MDYITDLERLEQLVDDREAQQLRDKYNSLDNLTRTRRGMTVAGSYSVDGEVSYALHAVGVRPPGLSFGHISPSGLVVTAAPGARLVKAGWSTGQPPDPPDGHEEIAKRGKITEFSTRSRARLFQRIGQIRKDAPRPFFITLTYPANFPTARASKRDLDVLFKRLRRRFPGAGWFWRLEPQKRGAPHYHLLIWGLPDAVGYLRRWFSRNWYDVVGSGDEKHLRAGTEVSRVRSWNGVMHYVSKYLAKLQEYECEEGGWEAPGRWWGYGGDVPLVDLVRVFLPLPAGARFLTRFCAACGMDAPSKETRGVWWMVDDPGGWAEIAKDLKTNFQM